jgi:hypothetical protein
MLKKGKIYRVYWHDTVSIEQWCNLDEITGHAKKSAENQETVGFYIAEAFNYQIFCSTKNNTEGMLPYANVTLIPKGCIRKVIPL